uniref:Uncharacterized protein n=1 Tax=Coccolithus braarudii TaxID=221442 RepID=A0A7S0LHI4_9EUKA|mmetsp:Transcript_35904/g.76637  ORF Transcript_35904/g.76637 Transcript_35904/m.76637 type:complete len:147 (+) Transcript_35904:334-774(+)
MLWMRFASNGKEVFAPGSMIRRWVIREAEANGEDAEWYEDEDEENEDEPSTAEADGLEGPVASGAPRQAPGAPKGSVKSGRWAPAEAKRPAHAIDAATWRPAKGAAATAHRPVASPRQHPTPTRGEQPTCEGFQAKLPWGLMSMGV